MGIYLLDNPPARDQYRSPRRKRPTGLTVVHTAESVMDSLGPDTGAEDVAAFIRRRSDAGSYHDLADSDTNLQLVRYEDEAYQDGTGSNPYAMSISFALRASDWPNLSAAKRAAFLRQGAVAFARQQAWLRANGYPTTPLRRVTRAQSDAGAAGFISHAERDPDRRTDPGPSFPWAEFFQHCRAAINQEDDMTPDEYRAAFVALMREAADRSTPTGRQLGDYITRAVTPSVVAGVWGAQVGTGDRRRTLASVLVSAESAALAAAARELGVDVEALASALAGAVGRIDIDEVSAAVAGQLVITPKEQT